MKKKIVVALILSCLFCALLHSAVPVSYASMVEENESLTTEETESVSNSESKEDLDSEESSEGLEELKNKENVEGVENTVDTNNVENKESYDNSERTEEPETTNESVEGKDEIFNEQARSLLNARLIDLSLFESTEFEASIENKTLTLTFIGTGLSISLLSEVYVTFILPNSINVNLLNRANISVYSGEGSSELSPFEGDVETGDFNSIRLREFKGLIGVTTKQTYKIEIEFDEPISSTNDVLNFGAVAADGLIDISVLGAEEYKEDAIQMPLSPKLSSIYDNTIVIKGELLEDFQAGSTVNVDIGDGEKRQADVNNENFSLTLAKTLDKGTIVNATVTTVDGLTSKPYSVTVKAAPQSLTVPNELNFGTVTIGSDVTYKFVEEHFQIIVQDTRGTNEQWQLQAHIDQPLTSESGHMLPNALGFHDGNVFKPFTTDATGTQSEAVAIETKTTQNDDEVPISWSPAEGKGPAIKVDHSTVYAEPYQTDITWTLVDAPLP